MSSLLASRHDRTANSRSLAHGHDHANPCGRAERFRRAAIEGRRLDVWQVMETVWASDGNVDESADYLGLRPDQVRAAISYYAEFPDEIDHWVQRNREEADRLYAQWGREQASLRR